MQYQNYEQWNEMAKRLQEPFQSMTELNIKTLKGLNYLKPEDFAHIKKPEELLEKQVDVLVENGHKGLDYMQQAFEILERAMLGLVQESKAVATNAVKK